MNDPSILDAFQAYDNAYQSVDPDQGFGSLGIWPVEAGKDDTPVLIVRGFSVTEGAFYPSKTNKDLKVPARNLQFQYQTTAEHPTMPNHQFNGVPFSLPVDPNSAGENEWRVERDMRRLKGHLQALLGDDFVDGAGWQSANLKNLAARFATGSVIVAKCKLENSRPNGKGGFYCNDYIISAE